MDWTQRTAHDLLDLLSRKQISAVSLARACLDSINAQNQAVAAFLHFDEPSVLEQAERIDQRRLRGEPLGPLAGLPIAVKDNICIQNQPTTCASKILTNYRPPYDAHVISRLRAADAILLGKTNLDEFAMGSSTENSALGTTRNPWDLTRIPGGSSGGSAAAVASGMVPVALGSDTGGSIRQPAALCSVVGLKPSYGRVSRFGLVAFGSSLDQIGPLTHDVEDAALLLEVIAGHDNRDATSVSSPVPRYRATLNTPMKAVTIGLPREFFTDGLDPEIAKAVRDAVGVYEQHGAKIVEISLPHSEYALAVYYLVATAEASSNLARYDGVHFGHRSTQGGNLIEMMEHTRGEGFGSEVKRRIMLGTYALSSGYRDAYYLKALKVRRLIKNDFDSAFTQCDVIAGPTSPTPAFRIGERADDPLAMYLADIYTISANLAGLAGISIPCGFTSQGLPIGLQLLTAPMEEEKLLRVAHQYQQFTDWHTRRPEIRR